MASGTGIGEFFISLGVDAVGGQLTVGNLLQTFGELEVATVAEIGLLWEMGVALARLVDYNVKATLGLEQFTMHTGLSAEALQKWQIVARQSHASAEDVTGSVENLTKHLANLAIGIPDSALASLQQLGISAFGAGGKLKTAYDILGEVRARLGVITSDAGQQERILAGLGISPNLRETLLLTNQLFNQKAGLAHGITPEQMVQFDTLYTRMQQIELVAKDIGSDIAAWASPAVMRFLDAELKALESLRWYWENTKGAQGDLRGSRTKDVAFENSAIGRLLGPSGGGPTEAHQQVADFFARLAGPGPTALPPEPAGGFRAAPTQVSIDKHDTYIIHDAHDPKKVQEVIERSWDETLQKKTVDGFDRQLNNGGY